MIKSVQLIVGCGNYSRKWGYSSHERYLIKNAKVSEASPCYYLIEGEAEVYQGKVSKKFLRKEFFKRKVTKKSSYLTMENVPNAQQFIMEEA
jgi:hypothetical protein